MLSPAQSNRFNGILPTA